MPKKPPSTAQIRRLLERRMKEVGAIRDRIRNDLHELDSLAETCDRSYEALQLAIEALSELA